MKNKTLRYQFYLEEEVKPAKPLEQTEANGESDSQNGVLLPKNIAGINTYLFVHSHY